jgi:multidrug resistance efflux pump
MQTTEIHPSQVQQDNRLKWQAVLFSRGVRFAVLGAFLVMVFLAIGFRILTVASIKGVVNAPILFIQSPIDGNVTMVGLRAGQTIDKGEILFQIENKRLDATNLSRVRSELEQSQASIDSLEILLLGYSDQRSDLDSRLQGYLGANKNNLTQRLNEAKEQQAKAADGEAQALRDFDRQKDLAAKGIDSKQAWEFAQLKWTQASKEMLAWKAVVERSQTGLDANVHGYLLDGYSGAPYAQQRMDEVDMRLSETKSKLAQEQKRHAALDKQVKAEESIAGTLSEATIRSPSLSLVQSVRTSKGSDVVKGTVLCELVDCDNSYVEASIPEEGFDRVRLGESATVYLYGNNGSIPGVVISVRGAGASTASNAEKSAALLNRTTPDSMIVNVSVSSSDLIKTFGSANQVGRTARIVLAKK